MSIGCCSPNPVPDGGYDSRYRRILWIALAINALMFVVEIAAGLAAGSVSLQADSLDFFADAANYGISLFVVGMALQVRAKAALFKGLTMAVFSVWVLGLTIWHAVHQTLPDAQTMGVVGFAALIANAIVFGLLWAYRNGDSNMRSVWICSRNDVMGNFAVIMASIGVFGTQTGWPDIVVALVMSALSIQGMIVIIRQARQELATQHDLT